MSKTGTFIGKSKLTALTIVHCILVAVALVLDCITLIKYAAFMTFAMKATIVLSIVGMLAAFGYILLGYSKKAAGLYKTYIIMYILACVISMCGITKYGNAEIADLMLKLVIFTILIILAFRTDNGKTASYILAGVLVLAALGQILYAVFGFAAYPQEKVSYAIMHRIAEFMLASTAGVMVMAKYTDKAERGTK